MITGLPLKSLSTFQGLVIRLYVSRQCSADAPFSPDTHYNGSASAKRRAREVSRLLRCLAGMATACHVTNVRAFLSVNERSTWKRG